MTKSDLIARISEVYPYMNPKNIDRVVEIIFGSIVGALQAGHRVELRGFGSFAVRQRKAVVGRNPRTGEKVNVGAKKVPFFKAGRQLKELINGSGDLERFSRENDEEFDG